jgi:hypothetical protein
LGAAGVAGAKVGLSSSSGGDLAAISRRSRPIAA